MTDARFPERWLNDRRLLRLSAVDFRTYVTTLVWSVSNRTDGYLEVDDLALVLGATADSSSALVAGGLWREQGRGWLVEDYATTQTSSHDLEVLDNARRREREKKARQRENKKGDSPGGSPEGRVPGTTQDRPGQARPGQEVGRFPSSEQVDDQDWPSVTPPGAVQFCRHGVTDGDQPAEDLNGRLNCPQCAMKLAS